MKFIRQLMAFTVASFFVLHAHAQFSGGASNYGIGAQTGPSQYGNGYGISNGSCGYQPKMPSAIKGFERQTKTNLKEIEKLEEQIDEARMKFDDAEDKIRGALQSDMAGVVTETYVESKVCPGNTREHSLDAEIKKKVCDPQPLVDGAIEAEVLCKAFYDDLASPQERQQCASGLKDYRKYKREIAEKERRMERLVTQNERLQERADTAYERYQERGNGGSEVCLECLARQNQQSGSFNWVRTGASAVMTGVGMYFDHKSRMASIQANQDIGWPTPISVPYLSTGFGYPFLSGGVYGGVYGGVTGGFGCAGSMNGGGYGSGPYGINGPYGMQNPYMNAGGAFGYPQGQFGQQQWGNGMYTPGVFPGGQIAGPWGLYGQQSPYGLNGVGYFGIAGQAAMGGFPGMYGQQMGGYPGMMQMGGYPGMQQMGGFPGMYGNQSGMMNCFVPPCPQFPGSQMSYPGTQMSYPGMQMSYPGMQMSYPGMQMSYPGMQMSYPGMQVSYPGMQTSYPGMQASYPGMQTSLPGFPGSTFPGSSSQYDYYYQYQRAVAERYQQTVQSSFSEYNNLMLELNTIQERMWRLQQQMSNPYYYTGSATGTTVPPPTTTPPTDGR
ncbi:MAG: hypothetical protein AB7F59_08120 [Bdellovibrionales bacterium]